MTYAEDISNHIKFVEAVDDYIDDCLSNGLSKKQILESFEMFIDERLEK